MRDKIWAGLAVCVMACGPGSAEVGRTEGSDDEQHNAALAAASCYRFEYADGPDARNLPIRIALMGADSGAAVWLTGGWDLIREDLAGTEARLMHDWRPLSGDSLEVRFGNGRVSVTERLRRSGRSLEGVARLQTDLLTGNETWLRATGTPVACL